MHQQTDTKRKSWVVLYTHIAQLITQRTIENIAAYVAIMLLSLLERVIKSQRVHISEALQKL